MKRIGVVIIRSLKLFLMPFLLAAFIVGCLYRVCQCLTRARRAA